MLFFIVSGLLAVAGVIGSIVAVRGDGYGRIPMRAGGDPAPHRR